MRMIGCDLHAAQQTIAIVGSRDWGNRREDVEARRDSGTGGLRGPDTAGCGRASKPPDRWDGFCGYLKPYYLDTQTSYVDHVAAGVF